MKELSIEEKAYDGNYKAYTELINRLENVKEAIKKQNYGIAVDILCKHYPYFQVTTHSELKESDDEKIRKDIISFVEQAIDAGYGIISKERKEKWIAWLEKQGRLTKALQISNSKIGDLIEENYYLRENLEKQGEQKPADVRTIGYWHVEDIEQKPTNKVEPKFHEGDWVVWQDKCYKVINNGCCYELVDQDGLSTSLEYGTIDENARLWDITKDAKDGDVLVCPKYVGDIIPNIFIFKNIKIKDNDVYCCCSFLETFRTESYIANADPINTDFYPATREQRDLLFKKMHDAGWKFDFEKKELKKVEQKSAWSEEDKKMLECALDMIEWYSGKNEDKSRLVSGWLKSLKDRIQSKKEWSDKYGCE